MRELHEKINNAASVVCVVLVFGFAVAVYFLGGFFSVAASNKDPAIVYWALAHTREASIARHATDSPPVSLDDAALVGSGAEAYAKLGCQSCHGGLGVKPARFSDGLNPRPNLKAVVADISPSEMFWVLKNGIRMSGMPSFGTGQDPVPDAELWSVVAFVKQVPSLSEGDLQTWISAHQGHS